MARILLKNESDITLYRADGSSVTFRIKSHVGSGASCVVYHATCDDKTEHLLKEYYPRSLNLERDLDGNLIIPKHKEDNFNSGKARFLDGCERQKEVRLFEDLKNYTSNVQNYFIGYNTEYIDMTVQAGRTYDKVENESLHTLFRRMKVLVQVIGKYHAKGFLHLDIKPENIYVRPEDETVEDLLLFDFDSVIEESRKMEYSALSYTKTWAAPEQLLAYKRSSLCKATDLFSIGEIIFTKIYGRHSKLEERRSFSSYEFDREAEIFKNVNPRVFPLLNELLSHTICNVIERRYQTADELIGMLDKLIPLANPKEPFLVSTLPTPKEFFIGRDAEIVEIHARLQQSPVLFLHGIGGIGKSELAKQYAKKYADEYDTVIFAPYVIDMVSLIANDNCIHIANFSRFEGEEAEDYYERKKKQIKELIADNGERILLIVDNLDTTEDQNIKLLFELGCRVLITSRVDMASIFKRPQIEVTAFGNLEFARELFEQYYHFSDEEAEDVDAIINLVQGHTLAIELIAKQIDAEWSNIKTIRSKLETGGLSFIGSENIDNAKDDIATQDSAFGHIKTLFDLSIFEKDDKDNELYVLANLSLMPFTGIDRRLFADWCDLDNHGGKTCVNNLIKRGWIQRNDDLIALHPLVAEISKLQYTNYNVFEPIFKNASNYTYSKEYANLVFTKRAVLSNLFLCISQRIIKDNIRTSYSSKFLSDASSVYMEYGYFSDAIKHRELALSISLEIQDIPQTIQTYIDLGDIYENAGDIDASEQMYLSALEITKSNDMVKEGEIYTGLGTLQKDRGYFEQAEKYFLKAKQIFENYYKDSCHYNLELVYNELGCLYVEHSDFCKAEEYLLKAAKLSSQLFGDCSKYIAYRYNSLGVLYTLWEKFNKSKKYLFRSLEIHQLLYGNEHAQLADTYNYIGQLHYFQTDFNNAKYHFSKSLELSIKLYGYKSPMVSALLGNLGVCCRELEEYIESENALIQSLNLCIDMFGEDHKDTAGAYASLGYLYKKLGNYVLASNYFKNALRIRELILGKNDVLTIKTKEAIEKCISKE